MTTKSFGVWIRTQTRRQDAIGDIARDIRDDTCGEGLDHRRLRNHIAVEHAAIPAALTAFDRAVAEWQTLRRASKELA